MNWKIIFANASCDMIGELTMGEFADIREATDNAWDMMADIHMSKDEFIRVNAGGVRVSNISHWVVTEAHE